jgi:hypothetical protein
MKLHAMVLSLVVALSSASIAAAQTDTPEARVQAVDRYFREVSMRDMMTEMVTEVSKQLPPEQRAPFETALLRNLRLDVVEAAARKSLARHLTVEELDTFTEFLRRPAGKSAMGKMKFYMADLMPVVQEEIVRAIKLTQSAQQ